MKFVIRSFFKTLRLVLGPVVLLRERLTRAGQPGCRSKTEQAA